MKAFCLLGVILLGIVNEAFPAPFVLDFSHSHTEKDTLNSGLTLREWPSLMYKDYTFENQEVVVRLPGGRSIVQRTDLGDIEIKDASVVKLSITGDVMPFNEAFKAALLFHQTFGIESTELERWYAINKDKGMDVREYYSPNAKGYPMVGVILQPSTSVWYPLVLRLEIQWGRPEFKGWDEARAARELPKPNANLASISVDAPSGLVYDRGEEFKDLKKSVAPPISPVPSLAPVTQTARPPEDATPAPERPLRPSGKILLLLLFLGMIGFVLWRLRPK